MATSLGMGISVVCCLHGRPRLAVHGADCLTEVPFDSSASANTMVLNPEVQDSTYVYQRYAIGMTGGDESSNTSDCPLY